MTPQQIKIVQNSWDKVIPIAATAADLFYARLFEINPETEKLFGNTDLAKQKRKLLQTLTETVASLDRFADLKSQLATLGRGHAGYGVTPTHYTNVGSALLWTLEQGLGEAWTKEVKEAWELAYDTIATQMQEGANSASTKIPAT